ncbi:MAG: ABC transporter permease [Dehalococcoidia bacterium]|nr:ABC transporter permease [Dehalococcoidia bacterium]
MKLYEIVAKDALARKRRLLFAAFGIVIGMMTVVGILTVARSGKAQIYDQLEKYGPNLSVLPAVSSLDMRLGNISLGQLNVGENYITEDKIPEIRSITDGLIREAIEVKIEGNIATVAPELYATTQVKGATVMVVGVDPEAERAIKSWWVVESGEYLTRDNDTLVGATAATVLGLKVGDAVTVGGAQTTVSGILEETGSVDDSQLFVSLTMLQNTLGKQGLVSAVNVRALCTACPVTVIADEINKTMTGVRAVAVKQVAETEMGMVNKVNKFLLAIAGITLCVGLFGVANTMMASVNERVKDIGIMRAVGASRNQILTMFVYEAIVIGIIGGIVGYLFGTVLAFLIGPIIFNGAAIGFVPQYLGVSLGLSIAVAILASVYPALRATRIKVADSLRSL